MKSLVIASAPRSGSTLTYRAVKRALAHELQTPWPDPAGMSGEILQHVLAPMSLPEPEVLAVSEKFFNAHVENYLWKHAGLPWAVGKGMLSDSGHNLLYLHRNPADCVYSLLERNWIWPVFVFDVPEDVKALYSRVENKALTDMEKLEVLPWVVDGVVAIQKLYRSIATKIISWDEVTSDPGSLYKVLESMGYNPGWHDYTSDGFRTVRGELLDRRRTALWQVAEKTCWIRGNDAEARALRYMAAITQGA